MITAKEAITQAMNTLNPSKEYTLDQERSQRRLDALREKWGAICPPIYQETDTNLIDDKKQDAIFGWNPADKKNLWIKGPSGTQKTRLAFLRLEQLHFSGWGCFAVNVVELANNLAIADGREREEKIEKLAKYAVLLLDDMGKEPNTQQVTSSLYLLAEKRMANKRVTIITSNSQTRAKTQDDTEYPTYRRLMENAVIVEFSK